MLRSRVIRSAAAIVAESPRETIAKNILKFKEIKAATTEAALAAAASSSPQLDLNALPAEIQGLKSYLSSAPAASGAAFQKDPTAWQNMSFGGMIGVEAQRDNTWPFVAGGIVTFVLLGVGIPALLPKEGKKNSKYISMIEGRHGKLEVHSHADSHAHH